MKTVPASQPLLHRTLEQVGHNSVVVAAVAGVADPFDVAALFEKARVDARASLACSEVGGDLIERELAFAGEEQGLIGAKAHAQKAAADKLAIDAVLNNDMVGNSNGGAGAIDSETVRVFAEGPEDSPSRQIARYMRRWTARYYPQQEIRLIARHDRFGRGGDHTAFNENGFAGVRITESNESNNLSGPLSFDIATERFLSGTLGAPRRVNALTLAWEVVRSGIATARSRR